MVKLFAVVLVVVFHSGLRVSQEMEREEQIVFIIWLKVPMKNVSYSIESLVDCFSMECALKTYLILIILLIHQTKWKDGRGKKPIIKFQANKYASEQKKKKNEEKSQRTLVERN